jgi:hypothetical protein
VVSVLSDLSQIRVARLTNIGRNNSDKVTHTDLSRYSYTSFGLTGKIVTEPRYYVG